MLDILKCADWGQDEEEGSFQVSSCFRRVFYFGQEHLQVVHSQVQTADYHRNDNRAEHGDHNDGAKVCWQINEGLGSPNEPQH